MEKAFYCKKKTTNTLKQKLNCSKSKQSKFTEKIVDTPINFSIYFYKKKNQTNEKYFFNFKSI